MMTNPLKAFTIHYYVRFYYFQIYRFFYGSFYIELILIIVKIWYLANACSAREGCSVIKIYILYNKDNHSLLLINIIYATGCQTNRRTS